jgi:DNA modification methylase
MNELQDNSVHLAITSPPYWQLKDYGIENQIGFHDSYESISLALLKVRVL